MSIITDTNKIQLFYGASLSTSITYNVAGNLVDMTNHGVIVGDFVYITSNTNGNGISEVTEIISDDEFRIDRTDGAGTVAGGLVARGKELDVYFADDESFEIISKRKTALAQWTTIENILGYRTIISVRTDTLTTAEREFLYQFAINNTVQYCLVNSTFYTVLLTNQAIVSRLIQGFFGAVSVDLEMVAKVLTRLLTPSFSGSSDSVGYKSANPLGTNITLTMNWGSLDISRNFTVALAQPYDVEVQKLDWAYIDDNLGRLTLGFKGSVFIDFGTFGYGQTEAELDDDRQFVKEFVLAPSKRITVKNNYIINVVNDFDEVRYSYLNNFIFAKTIQLSFRGKSIQTRQVNDGNSFVLDDNTFGILDSNVLG